MGGTAAQCDDGCQSRTLRNKYRKLKAYKSVCCRGCRMLSLHVQLHGSTGWCSSPLIRVHCRDAMHMHVVRACGYTEVVQSLRSGSQLTYTRTHVCVQNVRKKTRKTRNYRVDMAQWIWLSTTTLHHLPRRDVTSSQESALRQKRTCAEIAPYIDRESTQM
jgi:hypothetical protein